jgi:uncharacterized protein YcaQ
VYDLPERVLPDALLGAEPSDLECLTYLAGVTARALGVVTQADLIEYHRLNQLTSERFQHTRLVADAALAAGLVPVALADGAALLAPGRTTPRNPPGITAGWADPAALAEASAGLRGQHCVTLLSPFDSLIWDRKRTRQMFGFEHGIEAYVPKPKRVHGYYTMPLLAGGRLAGRVDPAREGTTLVARQVSLERAAAAEPMAAALREAAAWVGCDDVRLERIEPARHASRLTAALTRS